MTGRHVQYSFFLVRFESNVTFHDRFSEYAAYHISWKSVQL